MSDKINDGGPATETKPHIQNDKYESTGETVVLFGVTLYRIRARKAFGTVAAGVLGGFIAAENNLDVYGNAWVYGDARVSGNAWVSGNARVSGNAHYLTISPIGSEAGCLTAFLQKDGSILFNRGCFYGTKEQFLEAVRTKHKDSDTAKQYELCVALIETRLKP